MSRVPSKPNYHCVAVFCSALQCVAVEPIAVDESHSLRIQSSAKHTV